MTVITLIIISLYSWLSYKSYIRDENRLIISTSIKIEQSLAQSFNYANHLMDYFAKKFLVQLLIGDVNVKDMMEE